MPLGDENVVMQDQTDLNETVVQSFPANPRVYIITGALNLMN
jgi:hypothetical protein